MAKKRGQGEGSISKRPDGTWWARISIGRDDSGKVKRKAFYGKTRKEVQEKMTAAINDINQNVYINPSAMTFSKWLDTWMQEYKKPELKANTYALNHRLIETRIRPELGKVKIKDLRGDMIQSFINQLSSVGLAVGTVRKIYTIIYSALDQACVNEMISRNPAQHTKLPKSVKSKKKVLTLEEQQIFVQTLREKNIAYGDLLLLLLLTGLRIGEACALTWDDVDFDNNLIYVRKTLYRCNDDPYNPESKNRVMIGTPKSISSERNIPLLPDAVEILKTRKSYGTEFVFVGRSGEATEPMNIQRKLRKVAGDIGMKGLTPHSLRHTFATRGLESGIPLKVMQELLGHANLSMTADLYTHVFPEIKQSEMMKLANTIKLDTQSDTAAT